MKRNRSNQKAFIRKRCFDFITIFVFLTNLLKSSLQTELDNFFKVLFHKELPINNVSKSAFSQARHKLKYQAFIELNAEQVEYFYSHFSYKKWKGYRLVAVDGSTCRLPNSEKIVDEFGIADTSETGTPIILARLSQAYDMLNHVVIDSKLSNYHTSEHEMALGHVSSLQQGDLVLLDRNYASYWLFALLISRGISFCARLKVGSWKVAKQLVDSGKQEVIAEIFASKSSKVKCKKMGLGFMPLKLRFVCIELETGEKEVLITNIIDDLDYNEFEGLYHKRWFVEESYKQMKSRLEIENFTGKSSLAIKQDFYAKIFTGNLTAILAFPIHDKIKEKTKKRKSDYQLNFTQAISKMKDSVVLLFTRPLENIIQYIDHLGELFLANIEIVRPDRKNPHNFRKSKRIYPMPYKTPK